MRRALVSVVLGVLVAASGAAAQIPLERILKRVGDDIVTSLDVRRARLLKLAGASEAASDDAVVERLVWRRLELAVVRSSVKDLAPQRVADRRQDWARQFAGANVDALLTRAAMTEPTLESWLADDLRIDDYFDSVFGTATIPTRAETLKYYQEHIADYTQGGVVQDLAIVEATVRKDFTANRKATLMREWALSLARIRAADIR